MPNRLRTGIDVLDRMLDGGIPAGSVIALNAAPASQSELLLYELTATRRTLYLSTKRSSAAVQDALDRVNTRVGNPNIQELKSDAPIDHATHELRALPEECNLIIDPMDPLEDAESSRYENFMNAVQTHMINTDGLTFLHCLNGHSLPPQRDTTEYMADVVFDLDTSVRGDMIENRLTVPKFRGGRALEEPIKLELRERVSVDTSRDIA